MVGRLNFKKWIPATVILAALILGIGSLYAPWWTIGNPVAQRINTNITNNAFFNPSQTISANHIEPNENNTFSITVPFSELGLNITGTDALGSVFNTTFYVVVFGTLLMTLALALDIISILRRPLFDFSWISALAGAILLLIASINVVTQMPPALGILPTVMPSQIAVFSGSNVTALWGSTGDWTWAAGLGWMMMFTAMLLSGTAVILIRSGHQK